jgi:hypothetical protein
MSAAGPSLLVLHARKAGGTTVTQELKRVGCSFEEHEWGPFRLNGTNKFTVLIARDPVRRAVSSYLFEGGAPQCWYTKPPAWRRPMSVGMELLERCLPRYSKLAPFEVYLNASLRVWERGQPLTTLTEQRGLSHRGYMMGRVFVPNYLVRKLADGRADLALARKRLDAYVDAVVLNGKLCLLGAQKNTPVCVSRVHWGATWSAEGFVHKATPFDAALSIVKRELAKEVSMRHRATLNRLLHMDNQLYHQLAARCASFSEPSITLSTPP